MPDQRPNTDTLLQTFVTFYRDDSSAPYEWDAMWRKKNTNKWLFYLLLLLWGNVNDSLRVLHGSSLNSRWMQATFLISAMAINTYHLNVFLFCFFVSFVIESKNRTKHSKLTHATHTLTLNPKKRYSKNKKPPEPREPVNVRILPIIIAFYHRIAIKRMRTQEVTSSCRLNMHFVRWLRRRRRPNALRRVDFAFHARSCEPIHFSAHGKWKMIRCTIYFTVNDAAAATKNVW